MNFSKVGFTGFLFGVFLKAMSEDLGWTRSMTTGAVTIGSIAAAASSGFIAGRILDRSGPRLLVTVGGAFMIAAFIGLSRITLLWQFYLLYAVGRVVAMSLVSDAQMTAAVSKWFVRKRGRATAIAFMGAPLGGMVLSLLAERIIAIFSWREAWLALGVVTLILVIAPGAIFMRRTPEDMGLTPDGEALSEPAEEKTPYSHKQPEVSWTLEQAIRTPAFWLLSGVGIFGTIAGSIIGFHLYPYLTDKGINPAVAAMGLGLYSLFQGLGAPFWGFVIERWSIKAVINVTLALSAVAIVLMLMLTASTPVAALGASAFLGFAQGGFWSLNNVVWAVYFGRASIGTIRGISWGFQMLATAVGPLFASILFDATGSYSIPFGAAILANLICIALMWASKQPRAIPAPEPAGTVIEKR